jgi:hypothetical protein
MVNHLEALFPRLIGSGYQMKSPQSDDYNCIAWAAGPANAHTWWWPFGDPAKSFWPQNVPRAETLDAFSQLFASLHYSVCDHGDLEPGYEKVALYADDLGVPLHAARQLPDGRWTSKLGAMEDIEHALQDLVGMEYGTVVLVMKRPMAVGTG